MKQNVNSQHKNENGEICWEPLFKIINIFDIFTHVKRFISQFPISNNNFFIKWEIFRYLIFSSISLVMGNCFQTPFFKPALVYPNTFQ